MIIDTDHIAESIGDGFHALARRTLGRPASAVGVFVIVFVTLATSWISVLLYLGVNPTIVISVLAAPMWVFQVLLARRITKWVMKERRRP